MIIITVKIVSAWPELVSVRSLLNKISSRLSHYTHFQEEKQRNFKSL